MGYNRLWFITPSMQNRPCAHRDASMQQLISTRVTAVLAAEYLPLSVINVALLKLMQIRMVKLCPFFLLQMNGLFSQSYMWLLGQWGWECVRHLSSGAPPRPPGPPRPRGSTPRWNTLCPPKTPRCRSETRAFSPPSNGLSEAMLSRLGFELVFEMILRRQKLFSFSCVS